MIITEVHVREDRLNAPEDPDLCPYCKGQSPSQEQMAWQLDRGDTSGACSTCDNTHVSHKLV